MSCVPPPPTRRSTKNHGGIGIAQEQALGCESRGIYHLQRYYDQQEVRGQQEAVLGQQEVRGHPGAYEADVVGKIKYDHEVMYAHSHASFWHIADFSPVPSATVSSLRCCVSLTNRGTRSTSTLSVAITSPSVFVSERQAIYQHTRCI
jgi:hypothetical protein